MTVKQRLKIKPISDISKPNFYISALLTEYRDWAFNEKNVHLYKGNWRKEVFKCDENTPIDLELGTGNGLFFAHRAQTYPHRMIVGIERKFKPLIQSIRRARRAGSTNGRMVRYDANLPIDIFERGEVNDVFIQFPDPWEKLKWQKNRMIQANFLEGLHSLQRAGSFLEFKTDHREYFEKSLNIFESSPYKLLNFTFDLHNSEFSSQNFVTQFEALFVGKGKPIHYAKLIKPTL
jgi:tRNA (guanine-N7-)-methyltransferase